MCPRGPSTRFPAGTPVVDFIIDAPADVVSVGATNGTNSGSVGGVDASVERELARSHAP